MHNSSSFLDFSFWSMQRYWNVYVVLSSTCQWTIGSYIQCCAYVRGQSLTFPFPSWPSAPLVHSVKKKQQKRCVISIYLGCMNNSDTGITFQMSVSQSIYVFLGAPMACNCFRNIHERLARKIIIWNILKKKLNKDKKQQAAADSWWKCIVTLKLQFHPKKEWPIQLKNRKHVKHFTKRLKWGHNAETYGRFLFWFVFLCLSALVCSALLDGAPPCYLTFFQFLFSILNYRQWSPPSSEMCRLIWWSELLFKSDTKRSVTLNI